MVSEFCRACGGRGRGIRWQRGACLTIAMAPIIKQYSPNELVAVATSAPRRTRARGAARLEKALDATRTPHPAHASHNAQITPLACENQQHTHVHRGTGTTHQPHSPLHPPPLSARAAALRLGPRLPREPDGLFAFISCSLLCSVSPAHPQGQLLSPCQDASRAPPLAAADAGLLRASCRAGLGEEGREGAKLLEPPRRDARPRLCRPRGHRSVQASGQVPAPFSRLPLKFFSPGSGRCILPLQRIRAAWLSPEVGDISQDSPLHGPSDTSTADDPRPSLPSP